MGAHLSPSGQVGSSQKAISTAQALILVKLSCSPGSTCDVFIQVVLQCGFHASSEITVWKYHYAHLQQMAAVFIKHALMVFSHSQNSASLNVSADNVYLLSASFGISVATTYHLMSHLIVFIMYETCF